MSQRPLNRAVTIADAARAARKRIADLGGEAGAELVLRRNHEVRDRVVFAPCSMQDAPAIDRDDDVWLDVCVPCRHFACGARKYDFDWDEQYREIAAIPVDAGIEEGRTL